LRDTVRDVDHVARLGGDEFAVLATRLDPGEAASLVERLRAALADAGVTASVGWVAHDLHHDLAATLARADAAMYAEKRARQARA
jgi:diguanylate cyclase (GGDEF)-like protein